MMDFSETLDKIILEEVGVYNEEDRFIFLGMSNKTDYMNYSPINIAVLIEDTFDIELEDEKLDLIGLTVKEFKAYCLERFNEKL